MARKAGPFHSGTTTSGTTTGALEDTAFPIKSTISQDSFWKDVWAFMPSVTAADQVRVVKTYSPTAGTLTPDLAYGSAYTSTAYELHSVIEPGTDAPRFINEALKQLFIPSEFSFTPANATNQRHSLAVAAPWLTNHLWIRRVGVLKATDDRNAMDPYQHSAGLMGNAYMDGGVCYLDIGARSTSDTVYVQCLKPAYYHCATVALPTYGSQSGLILDTDTVDPAVSLEWIGFSALAVGLREYETNQALSDRVTLSQKKAEAEALAQNPMYVNTMPRIFRRKRHWGPAQYGLTIDGWAVSETV